MDTIFRIDVDVDGDDDDDNVEINIKSLNADIEEEVNKELMKNVNNYSDQIKDPGCCHIIPRIICAYVDDHDKNNNHNYHKNHNIELSLINIEKYLTIRYHNIMVINLLDISLLSKVIKVFPKLHDKILCKNYPFPIDGSCPGFDIIQEICQSIEDYLNSVPGSIVCFICEDAFYKSGLLISCSLIHSGYYYNTASEALNYFLKRRQAGIGHHLPPSFIRYIHYYEASLKAPFIENYNIQLDIARLITVPNFSHSLDPNKGGCNPYITIDVLNNKNLIIEDNHITNYEMIRVYSSLDTYNKKVSENCKNTSDFYKKKILKIGSAPFVNSGPGYATMTISSEEHPIIVNGDVRISFYSTNYKSSSSNIKSKSSENTLLARVWFHTAFIEGRYLSFQKEVIDEAVDDVMHSIYSRDFAIELFCHRVNK